jgi:methanogenic corrinoid protein MtbC1
VYQEHFFTQYLGQYLTTETARLRNSTGRPLVLLGTLPGELHILGLSMTAAMLACHGLSSIQLGASMPVDQLSKAAQEFNVDILGVSFSSAYPYGNIRNDLRELRDSVPGDIDIWVGGEGVRKQRKLPVGVSKFTDFEKLPF